LSYATPDWKSRVAKALCKVAPIIGKELAQINVVGPLTELLDDKENNSDVLICVLDGFI
jgi:hypothetical protein